jgi:hypothetical protein
MGQPAGEGRPRRSPTLLIEHGQQYFAADPASLPSGRTVALAVQGNCGISGRSGIRLQLLQPPH